MSGYRRTFTTPRLILRPWELTDAAALEPILAANYAHLGPWIPPRIANPEPVRALENRIRQFEIEFERDKEWRYAIILEADGMLVGELSVFPRSAAGRVAYTESDRVEIGYWVRKDLTSRGIATEAVSAILPVLREDAQFSVVEIRCDPRNEPSNAIPRKLGFELTQESGLNVWRQGEGYEGRGWRGDG